MESEKLIHRLDYSYFHSITTRWADNDIYGHVNNVVYYSYFDTVANQYLIEFANFNPINDAIIGFVVHSNCTYIKAIAYPNKIEAGLIVKKIGNSSVTYGIGQACPALPLFEALYGTAFCDKPGSASYSPKMAITGLPEP